MACVRRVPKSPYWIAKYRDETGAHRFKTTKECNRVKAQGIANEWERQAAKARRGVLTKAAVLGELSNILERATGERLETKTVRDFFASWLGGKAARGYSDATVRRYRGVLDRFQRHLGERRCKVSIAGITGSDVESFRDNELKAGKGKTTANFSHRVLSAVFSDARRQLLIAGNPAKSVRELDACSEERQPFTEDQIRSLLSAADEVWRGVILFGVHAGLRIGDAARLTWAAIDLQEGTLSFVPQKTARRSHGKPLRIALHSDLQAYLMSLSAPDDDPNAPLFPELLGRATGGHQGLSNGFARLMHKAKITPDLGHEKKGKGRRFRTLGSHSMRHSFISSLVNSDVNADVRKELADHSTDESHTRYVHLDLATQRRALSRLPSYLR